MKEINATIKSTQLTIAEMGHLSVWLHLDYGGSGQGFGGYALGSTLEPLRDGTPNVAGLFIIRCLQAAGVTEWKELVGKNVRVRSEDGLLKEIGHITEEDKWFNPRKEFENAL